jgi:hypothetical protein
MRPSKGRFQQAARPVADRRQQRRVCADVAQQAWHACTGELESVREAAVRDVQLALYCGPHVSERPYRAKQHDVGTTLAKNAVQALSDTRRGEQHFRGKSNDLLWEVAVTLGSAQVR